MDYIFRLVDTKKQGYDHVYVKSNGVTLDCVLGQSQNNQDSFFNREINGMFDQEVEYWYKKDYSPMLTVVNGRVRSTRYKVNGFFDSVADLLGSECKRSCDIRFLNDTVARQACKDECDKTAGSYGGINVSCPDRCTAMYPNDLNARQECIRDCYGTPKDNTMLYVGAAALVGLYFLSRKK
jgi:hypothetical protein